MALNEVKLLLSAKDDLSKTLADVEQALESLVKQQTELGKASEESGQGIDELRQNLAQLQNARKAILQQTNILEKFKSETEALERENVVLAEQRKILEQLTAAQKKAESQKDAATADLTAANKTLSTLKRQKDAVSEGGKAYETLKRQIASATSGLQEYEQKLANTENVQERQTKALAKRRAALDALQQKEREQAAQQAELAKQYEAQEKVVRQLTDTRNKSVNAAKAEQEAYKNQSAEVAKLEKSLERRSAAIQKAGDRLRQFGLETDDVTASEERLVRVAKTLEPALQQAQQGIEGFDTGAARAKENTRKLADEAERAASRLSKVNLDKSLGTGRGGSGSDAAAAVSKIINPANEAAESLDSLAKTGERYADKIEEIGKSSQDSATKMEALQGVLNDIRVAQRSAVEQSKAIDSYERQSRVVGEWSAKLDQAEARVRELAAAVRSAEQPNESLNSDLRDSRRELEQIANSYRQAAGTLATYKANLNGLGVDTNQLSAAQQRLVAATQKSVENSRKATEKLKELRAASQGVRNEFELIPTSGRQALDFFQRLRGQVLSTISAYVGLFAAVQGVREAVNASTTGVAIESRLELVAGDAQGAAVLYDQLRGTADRLGLSLEKLATEYSKIAVAGKASGLEQEQVNFIFESFAEASSKLRLSAEDTEGVFRALSQTLNKGRVSSEELVQQLGERVPGAFSLFAESLREPNETIEEASARISKLLEQGKISSAALIPFAENIRKTFATTKKDLSSLDKEIQRFQTSVFEARRAFADEEFQQNLADLIKRFREIFASEEFQRGLDDLKTAFFAVGNAIAFLVEDMARLKFVLTSLLYLGAARYFVSLSAAIINGAAALKIFSTSALATKISVDALQTSVRRLVAAIFGLYLLYDILDTLVETNVEAKAFAITLVTVLLKAWERVKAASLQAVQGIKSAFYSMGQSIVSAFRQTVKTLIGLFTGAGKALARLAGSPELVKALEDVDKKISGFGKGVEDSFAQGRAAAQNEIAKISKDLDDALTKLDDLAVGAIAAARGEATAGSRPRPSLPDGLDDEGGNQAGTIFRDSGSDAEKEAEKLRDSIAKIIADTERKIAEETATTLEDRLALIADDYADFYKEVEAALAAGSISPETAQQANLLLGRLTVIRQEKERITFQQEQLEKAEEDYQALLEQRDRKIALIRQRQELGEINQFEAAAQIDEITGSYQQKLIDSAIAARDLAEALGDNAVVEKLNADIEGYRANVKLLGRQYNEDIAQGGANALMALGEGLGRVIDGTGSLSDAFRSAGRAFQQFAADFLREIANMILKQAIFNAISGSIGGGGGVGGTVANAVGAVLHSGGIVGTDGARRSVPLMAFAGAARFHSGGMPGLKSDEVPAILQRGEEVLAKNDPRNALNGGGGSTQVKIVNTIDSAEVVSQGLSTVSGEKAILNVIRANKSSIKSVLS